MHGSTRAAAVVIGVGVVAGVHVGVLPPMLPQLRESTGMSLFGAGLLLSVFQLAMCLLGIAGGALAERIGRERLPLIGISLMIVADTLCALAVGESSLFLGRSLGSLAFLCMLIPGPALLLRIVPPENQRFMLGIYASYMPVGMGLGMLLAPPILDAAGLSAVWWFCACLSAGLLYAFYRWVVPMARPAAASSAVPSTNGSLVQLLGQTLRHGKPLLLALGFCFYAAQWMTVMSFLPSFYRSEGISLGVAGAMTAFAVMVNALGTTAAGALLQRGVSRARLLGAASVVMLLGAGLVFSWESGVMAIRYFALLAFSAFGGLIPGTLFASTGAYAPTPQTVPTTTGLMQQGSALGQFIAAPAMGAIVGATGSWAWAWALSGSLAAAVLLVALAIHQVDRRLGTSV